MLTFAEQASAVSDAFADAASKLGAKPVFKRYFLSDSATQTDALFAIAEKQSECAVSVVEQPPLNGTKVALWAYLQTDVEIESAGNGMFVAKHGDFKHIWSGYNYSDGKDSEEVVRDILKIDGHYRIVGILALGHSDNIPKPHDESDLDKNKIHFLV